MTNPSLRPQQYQSSSAVSSSVNELTIHAVVDEFYSAARQDPLLGPVFETHVNDWPAHMEIMYAFWASVLCGERRYSGNPFQKHLRITELRAEHFTRWLDLFSVTVAQHCTPQDAAAWDAAARRMGFALSSRLGLGLRSELLL